MGFLARLFGAVSRQERGGIRMEHPAWEVSGVQVLPGFLRALPALLPPGSILYLEGTSARDVIEFLSGRAAAEPRKVAVGTIWPRPRVFHMPASPENLAALAQLADHHAAPEVCIHLHAYEQDRILLEWYDAILDTSFSLSSEFAGEQVAEFCRRLGGSYTAVR